MLNFLLIFTDSFSLFTILRYKPGVRAEGNERKKFRPGIRFERNQGKQLLHPISGRMTLAKSCFTFCFCFVFFYQSEAYMQTCGSRFDLSVSKITFRISL